MNICMYHKTAGKTKAILQTMKYHTTISPYQTHQSECSLKKPHSKQGHGETDVSHRDDQRYKGKLTILIGGGSTVDAAPKARAITQRGLVTHLAVAVPLAVTHLLHHIAVRAYMALHTSYQAKPLNILIPTDVPQHATP